MFHTNKLIIGLFRDLMKNNENPGCYFFRQNSTYKNYVLFAENVNLKFSIYDENKYL